MPQNSLVFLRNCTVGSTSVFKALNSITADNQINASFTGTITESFRHAGTSGCLWSKLLLRAEPALRSDQVAQGFIQSSLKKLQGWRLHGFSEQPAQTLGSSQSAISFLAPSWNFLCFNLCPFPTIPFCEGSGSIPSKTTPQALLGAPAAASYPG